MAYNIFSQPQGPQIDVNLFGSAVAQGVQTGNQLPTPLTAGIRGLQEGIKAGQEYRQNEAQISNAESVAQINEMKAKALAQDYDLQLKIEHQKAQNELQAATAANESFTNKKEITDILSNPNPQVQASVLNDPRLKGALLNDPVFADSVTGALRGNPYADPEALKQVEGSIGYYKQRELELKQKEVDAKSRSDIDKNFDEIVSKVNKDGQLSYLRNQYGLDEKGLGSIQTYPHGVKTFKDGELDSSVPDRQITAFETGATKYDVVINGKLANIPLDESSNSNLQALQFGLRAKGLIPNVLSGSAAHTPEVAPTNTPSSKPYSAALFGQSTPQEFSTPQPTPNAVPTATPGAGQLVSNSDSPIINQRAKQLEIQAQTNPDLRNRLIAKGILAGGSAVNQQPTPTPTVAPSPISAPPTQNAISSNPQTTAPQIAPTLTPSVVKQQVSQILQGLPKEARKGVDSDVVFKVASNPMLKDLNSTHKAIVAVESGGNAKAKAVGSSAQGYFQLTKAAAKDVKVNAANPEENIKGGVAYYDQLLQKYSNAEVPALMAYNLGAGVIDSAINLTGSYDYSDIVNGVDYLKAHGFYKEILTPKNLKAGYAYPLKVLAYKKIFDSVSYG